LRRLGGGRFPARVAGPDRRAGGGGNRMSSRTAFRLTRILAMLPWVIANPGATIEEVRDRVGYKDTEDLARDLDVVFVCGLPGYGPGELMGAYIDGGEVLVDAADYCGRAPRLSPTEALSMLAAGMAVLS